MKKISNQELVKILKDAKKQSKKLVHITDKSALSPEDNMKINLCRHFVRYGISKKMLSKDLAKLVGVPKTRMSEITNYKIKNFTIDKLIEYLVALGKHDPQVREYVIMLTQATEIPTPTVSVSKRLARELSEASVHA